jgi:L-2-hydroxyglutarate oxidase LhgO
LIDDPNAHGVEGLVCLFGIESPGLTSSLALGEEVAARLGA